MSTMDGRSLNGKFYELKTYNKRWTGQLSRTWYWQGVQQAICTGSNEINWIIFDSDLQLQFHTQTVTSDEKQIHIEAARKFLGFIDMGMMPDVADPTYDNAASLYPEGYGNTVVLGHEVYASLERLAQAREQKKQAESVEELIKGELAMLLQDAEYGAIDGVQVVSWKNSKRTSFVPQSQKRAQIDVTPMPTDANVDTPYIATVQISESPNIVETNTLPDNFAGDLTTQVGRDDLHIEQEKITDLQ